MRVHFFWTIFFLSLLSLSLRSKVQSPFVRARLNTRGIRLLLPLRAILYHERTRAFLHSRDDDDDDDDALFKIVRAHARVHGRNNLEIFLFPRVSLVSDARTFAPRERFDLPEVYLRRKEMVETPETPTGASGARAEPNF